MMNTNTSLDEHSKFTQQLDTWLKNTHELATQTGCLKAVEPVLKTLKKINKDSINIAFIGSPNSGKSSLINQILDLQILPVTALSIHTQFYIEGENNKNKEGFFFAEDRTLYPLKDLYKNDLFSKSSETLARIYLCHQWLIDNSFHLTEKLALDASEEDIKDVTNSFLEETDYVVLVIDALMPLKKAETYFLSECVRRGIPVVIALSKIDKLLPEELEDVITYVTNHAKLYSTSIKLIPTSIKLSDESNISNLKTAIQEVINETDLLFVRTQQVAHTLLGVLDIILSAAQTGLENQKQDELEIALKFKQCQQQLDLQNLVWQHIEQQIDLKRQKVDDMLRQHLQDNRTIILEILLHELQCCNDIKTWWNRDFPFRLEPELNKVAKQLSGAINKQITLDVQWLQEEISKQFQYPLQVLSESSISVDKASVEQREVQLSNQNTLKIISRIGTVVSVLVAGTVLGPLGFGSAGIAASAMAGLTAEQLIRWNTNKEREKICSEINKVIERVEHQYALEVSGKLKESYNQVISDVKQHQIRWQQAQLQTLIAINSKPVNKSGQNWEQIVKQTNQMMVEIKEISRK
jgi:GTP-binding protein EngB required for normal cell division